MNDNSFDRALRGYHTAQVNELVALVSHAVDSGDAAQRARALTALRDATFVITMRGYNRKQVEARLDQLRARLGDGSRQP